MKELEQMVEKYNLKEKILKGFEEFIKYNKESNPDWFNLEYHITAYPAGCHGFEFPEEIS